MRESTFFTPDEASLGYMHIASVKFILGKPSHTLHDSQPFWLRIARPGRAFIILYSSFTREGMLLAAILVVSYAKVAIGIDAHGVSDLMMASKDEDAIGIDVNATHEKVEKVDVGDMDNINDMDSTQPDRNT